MTNRMMWAVGPDDGVGWEAIDAETEAGTRVQWAERNGQEDVPEWVVALRQEAWDALPEITGADWLRAGLGHTCIECQELAYLEFGARIIDGQPICGECLSEQGEMA